jgi:hypothetical protein
MGKRPLPNFIIIYIYIYIWEKYILPPNISHLFQFCLQSAKTLQCTPSQVLKNSNVAYSILKSVCFDRNRLTCDTRGFLRENLPKIFLKKTFFFKKEKRKSKQPKKGKEK